MGIEAMYDDDDRDDMMGSCYDGVMGPWGHRGRGGGGYCG